MPVFSALAIFQTGLSAAAVAFPLFCETPNHKKTDFLLQPLKTLNLKTSKIHCAGNITAHQNNFDEL